MDARREVVLGADPLSADDLMEVVDGTRLRLGLSGRSRMALSRTMLLAAIERGAPVYGATRRLGAGSGDVVADQAAFQVQVIRNHCGAIGDPLPAELVRAGIAARIGQLSLGGSGARPELADALAALLDRDVVPLVPDTGSVGMADLAQLAAVAAVLIGEGAALAPDGSAVPGAQALAAAGLQPIVLDTGEALALINTNAFTTGAAGVLLPRLDSVAIALDLVVALSLEAAAAWRDSGGLGPYSDAPNAPLDDRGQGGSAGMIRRHLAGSFLEEERAARVQDELSFRCAPQVHGALVDTADDLGRGVVDALALPPENPLVDVETGDVVPNGNFAMTGFVLTLETVRLALAHVAQLVERRTAVLSALARPLRAADRAGIPGLLAYSSAELLTRVRSLAAPVSLASPVLSEVEDYATFGWTAVKQAHEALDLLVDMAAIEALHATSLLRAADPPPRLGAGTAPLHAALAAVVEAGGTAEALVAAAVDVLLAASDDVLDAARGTPA